MQNWGICVVNNVDTFNQSMISTITTFSQQSGFKVRVNEKCTSQPVADIIFTSGSNVSCGFILTIHRDANHSQMIKEERLHQLASSFRHSFLFVMSPPSLTKALQGKYYTFILKAGVKAGKPSLLLCTHIQEFLHQALSLVKHLVLAQRMDVHRERSQERAIISSLFDIRVKCLEESLDFLSEHDVHMLLTTFGSILRIARIEDPRLIIQHTDMNSIKAVQVVKFFAKLGHLKQIGVA